MKRKTCACSTGCAVFGSVSKRFSMQWNMFGNRERNTLCSALDTLAVNQYQHLQIKSKSHNYNLKK